MENKTDNYNKGWCQSKANLNSCVKSLFQKDYCNKEKGILLWGKAIARADHLKRQPVRAFPLLREVDKGERTRQGDRGRLGGIAKF